MLERWRFGNDELRGACLGLRLEPLTLGHVFLLREYGVDIFEPKDFADMLLSVFVCSHPHRESRRNLRKWWLKPYLVFWGWRVRKLKFEAEAKAFAEYVNTNATHPEVLFSEGTKECASPLVFRLAAIATRMHNQGWADAQDIPIRTLIAIQTAGSEMRGELQVWGERHEEFFQWAKEQDELKRKAKDGTAPSPVQA